MLETWVRSLDQEDPLEEEMATHSSISCLENPHGQRSLMGYHPGGHKESDMTEQLPLSLFTVFSNRTPWKAYPFCLDLISLLLTPSSPPQPAFCLYQAYQDSPRGAAELRPPRTGPFDETGHSLFCEVLGVASRTHSGECSSAYSYGRFVLIPS